MKALIASCLLFSLFMLVLGIYYKSFLGIVYYVITSGILAATLAKMRKTEQKK